MLQINRIMRPKGLIYQAGKSGTHGELILFLPLLVKFSYQIIRTAGASLIAVAVLTFYFSFGPVIEKEVSYTLSSNRGTEHFSYNLTEALEIEAVQKEAREYGVNSYFSVVIPKIEASSNVIANVDVSSKEEYLDALKKGIAHAKGTYFPGQGGRVFLFSHSTDSPLNFARYNAIFYLLTKLEKNDLIIIFFADKRYVYEVDDKISADISDVAWIQPKKEEEELVLMTCDPPGTTWRRLLVIAKPLQ